MKKYIEYVFLISVILSVIFIAGCIGSNSEKSDNGPEIDRIFEISKTLDPYDVALYPLGTYHSGDELKVTITDIDGGKDIVEFCLLRQTLDGEKTDD